MTIFVDASAWRSGDGSKLRPYKTISEAADRALPGDEVLVAPGVYREYVDPKHAGTADQRITYRSEKPLGAVITGAEKVENWTHYEGSVWTARVGNGLFGSYNPYTTYVYGDWYFAGKSRHTGAVYLNNRMMYEACSLEAVLKAEKNPYSWVPEESVYQWYAGQDGGQTVFYVNFQDKNPNQENVEINVRRECFMPQQTGIGYITVSGFVVTKAATTWAPPAAYQDCMIGPHWSKGWIIEDCEISNSKCAGIGLGKYYDPENDHYFTTKHVKSPTQMERDAVCRGQYHGWLKENIGSHIIRRCDIHHCEQGGIIGRMGGVFSVIEDNYIHDINNMCELGGAEIAGIKMHAAIDVTIRRNFIRHCTMGIWCDWEAQGTRISQNLLMENQRPAFAKQLPGGMMSQDLFVEVGHGPTLIDNNILMGDASLRIATEGVAMVHNLVCGAFTCVGTATDGIVDGVLRQRFTPYHIPHRTEVCGFMTILHGDDRFYNNIFFQKWSAEPYRHESDSHPGEFELNNREVGTHVFDEYPDYDEWIAQFDMDTDTPDMGKLESAHWGHLPVWADGNAYFGGARHWKKEKHFLMEGDAEEETSTAGGMQNAGAPLHTRDSQPQTGNGHAENFHADIVMKDGRPYLDTNLFDLLGDFSCDLIDSDTLGRAFEPDERFENPDGSTIVFDRDYFGDHRGVNPLPGPFAGKEDLKKPLW